MSSTSYWSRNFSLILIGNALLFMVYNMQVPVLPLFGKKLGLTPAQIGIFCWCHYVCCANYPVICAVVFTTVQ